MSGFDAARRLLTSSYVYGQNGKQQKGEEAWVLDICAYVLLDAVSVLCLYHMMRMLSNQILHVSLTAPSISEVTWSVFPARPKSGNRSSTQIHQGVNNSVKSTLTG